MAKDPSSESPGVRDPDKATTTSLASKLGLSFFSRSLEEQEEQDETPDNSHTKEDEEQDEEQQISSPNQSPTTVNNEPETLSPTIIEPIRPSAIAARRHLQRPPRNVNVASHPSGSRLQPPKDNQGAPFPTPPPLPPSAGVARTPATADLRETLKSRIYEPDVMDIIEAYADEKVKRDRKELQDANRLHSRAANDVVYGLEQTEYQSPIAALRVRMMLMPAVLLLSKPSSLKADDVEKAIRYARVAQDIARNGDVEKELEARCSYYIGLAAFLLLPKHALLASSRPASIGSLSELGKLETVQSYFEQACAAKGVYEEGDWAEEWVVYLESPEVSKELSESVEDERPTSSGSWVSGWMKRVWGSKESHQQSSNDHSVKRPPGSILRSRRDSATSEHTESTFRPSGPERIPSFESWHSDEPRPESAMSEERFPGPFKIPQDTDDDESPRERIWFNDLTPDSPEPILPAPVTSPHTSPTKRISFAGLSKTAAPSASSDNTPISSPIYERRHSRRPSLLARVTGRERRPSELERAEEGSSPYRSTFEPMPEGTEGLKKRKSTDPEDIV